VFDVHDAVANAQLATRTTKTVSRRTRPFKTCLIGQEIVWFDPRVVLERFDDDFARNFEGLVSISGFIG
jgi:hypothetical protein